MTNNASETGLGKIKIRHVEALIPCYTSLLEAAFRRCVLAHLCDKFSAIRAPKRRPHGRWESYVWKRVYDNSQSVWAAWVSPKRFTYYGDWRECEKDFKLGLKVGARWDCELIAWRRAMAQKPAKRICKSSSTKCSSVALRVRMRLRAVFEPVYLCMIFVY